MVVFVLVFHNLALHVMQAPQKTWFCIPAPIHKGKVSANAVMFSNTASYTTCPGNKDLFISFSLKLLWQSICYKLLSELGVGSYRTSIWYLSDLVLSPWVYQLKLLDMCERRGHKL